MPALPQPLHSASCSPTSRSTTTAGGGSGGAGGQGGRAAGGSHPARPGHRDQAGGAGRPGPSKGGCWQLDGARRAVGQRAAALHPPARAPPTELPTFKPHTQASSRSGRCSSLPPPIPLQEELQTRLANKESAFADLEARFVKLEEDTGATQAGAVGGRETGLWMAEQGCSSASLLVLLIRHRRSSLLIQASAAPPPRCCPHRRPRAAASSRSRSSSWLPCTSSTTRR